MPKKPGLEGKRCAHCATRPVATGKSHQALTVARSGLCYACYSNKPVGQARQKALGIKQSIHAGTPHTPAGKPKICTHCGTHPVAIGESHFSRLIQGLGLCHTCYKDKAVRQARQKALGIDPRTRAGKGRPPGQRTRTHQSAPPHRARAPAMPRPDSLGKAIKALGDDVVAAIREEAELLRTEVSELVRRTYTWVGDIRRRREEVHRMMSNIEKHARESAAEARRELQSLRGTRREVHDTVRHMPTPLVDAHLAKEAGEAQVSKDGKTEGAAS